ncbi:histidinol-phosphate transaminase [Corynebacterium sp. H128]|uniref:histidinol-phosphate transaminase n=1 Tax=unclassified Corynebacterium TaxID=2624378 RepID=UPI0030A28CEA
MIRADLSKLQAYKPGKKLPHALKLSSNEVTAGPLPAALATMQEALAESNRYPDMGCMALREALATHLSTSVAHIGVGTGSSALCQQLVQATALPGDEVMYAWRSFEAYPLFVAITGATSVQVPLDDAHRHDFPAMLRAITERTRLIFVCNPNNPTGTTITHSEFVEFMDQVPAQVTVALDEAYFEYNRGDDQPDAAQLVQQYPNLVGLRTFSKAYGLAGARVGYAVGNPEIIAAMAKVAVPFGVSSVAQAGALASLQARDELLARTDDVVKQRARVQEHVAAVPSEANFLWVPRVDAEQLGTELAAAGAVTRVFPGEGVRITVTNEEEMSEFLRIWDKVVNKTQ